MRGGKRKITHKKVMSGSGRKSALAKLIEDINYSEKKLLIDYKKYAKEAKDYFDSYNNFHMH